MLIEEGHELGRIEKRKDVARCEVKEYVIRCTSCRRWNAEEVKLRR